MTSVALLTARSATSRTLASTGAVHSPAPVVIEVERADDASARELLLDRAFGPTRFAKTCEMLRANRRPAAGLSLVARAPALDISDREGVLVGTVRLWHVDAGGVPALMLGPLAVDDDWRCHRIGATLMAEAISRARAAGHRAILLVGDAPYYARFGFARRHTRGLRMPGPVEFDRFLGLELAEGALEAAKGVVKPTGAIDLAAWRRQHRAKLPRAA